MKKYRVHFQQVNQCNIEVEALSRCDAARRAYQQWKCEKANMPVGKVEILSNRREYYYANKNRRKRA